MGHCTGARAPNLPTGVGRPAMALVSLRSHGQPNRGALHAGLAFLAEADPISGTRVSRMLKH